MASATRLTVCSNAPDSDPFAIYSFIFAVISFFDTQTRIHWYRQMTAGTIRLVQRGRS